MARLRVSETIEAPPRRVWRDLRDIESHVEWMADATEIRFSGERRRGVGTRFECDTKVGPLKVTDVMEVTEWRPRRAMGVIHTGVVTGRGRFTLRRRRGGRTRFTWSETLRFPWWMGGSVGAVVGSEILRLVWKGNLRRLARRAGG